MNSRNKNILIGSALALVISTISSQAATLVNGSFETGTYTPNGSGFHTLFNGSTAIDGWTVGAGGVDWIGSYWQPSDGQKSLDLSGNALGSISQTVNDFVVGEKYKISFDMAGNDDGGDAVKSLIAAVIAGEEFFFNITGSTTNSAMGWITKTLLFTATSTSHTLSFTSGEDNAYGAALDNVSISAVPLPAALPLFTTAVAGMGLLGWRRRRSGVARA